MLSRRGVVPAKTWPAHSYRGYPDGTEKRINAGVYGNRVYFMLTLKSSLAVSNHETGAKYTLSDMEYPVHMFDV